MRALLLGLLIATPAVVMAACDSYSPDLGERPFFCGDDNACPDGYEARTSGWAAR